MAHKEISSGGGGRHVNSLTCCDKGLSPECVLYGSGCDQGMNDHSRRSSKILRTAGWDLAVQAHRLSLLPHMVM